VGDLAKNALFFVIDCLRYDVLQTPERLRALAPNLAGLVERGDLRRVVANAQSTQFVMPSIFSATYPLDHDGYNNGIRERPASYAECLRDAGYETHMAVTCNQLGMSLGYERGFDRVHSTVDFRFILQYRIEKTLNYELSLHDAGEVSYEHARNRVADELKLLLIALRADFEKGDKAFCPPRLRDYNAKVAAGAQAEIELLERDPDAVMKKLRALPAKLYWRALGRAQVSAFERFRWRAQESVNWRTRKLSIALGLPFMPLGHFQSLSSDVMPRVCEIVREAGRPWALHVHVMDVHDCRSISRPLAMLARLRYLPRLLRARRAGHTDRKVMFDLALMALDTDLGKLLCALENDGLMDDTVILVTGDHGSRYANSPRDPIAELGHRTHWEDIDVPLLLVGAERPMSDEGLVDSMGMPVTLLDAVGVQAHPSFKGISALSGGRTVVVTENAGRGNADLVRRDLHFTVTGKDYKLMASLVGSTLVAKQFYDLKADPLELDDLLKRGPAPQAVDRMLRALVHERADLMAARGVEWPDAEMDARAASQ
tara:strand:+ start:3877 stop:5505 length:1629 start_codon:yes stop_codon:yes gene_type:complete